ncbi:calmodulin-binding receptor-like cytoplasmic kinase 2 [Quercus robur]|uniref:calmodulin-binding receptor-like cytoplasmic kinase 2 n=1 Tax=Quercus robur TaxID=38942 RepID=UPI002161BAAC|nr:calmodulin-binding receptor-like cytoplasmic kinase 2 [Quercus robur]
MASTSTSSSSSQSSSIFDDPSNPLYLHHGDSRGAMLVYQPLVGENYPTWARSMQMALIAKNKLGFIDGKLTLISNGHDTIGNSSLDLLQQNSCFVDPQFHFSRNYYKFRYFWLQNLLPTIAQTLAVGYGMEKNPTPDFPMQLSIASLFPAYNFDPETNASSESNEIPPNFSLYSNFIMPLFPPARSQTDNVSENDEINLTDPSISALATPKRHTIQTSSFRDVLDASRAGSERKRVLNRADLISANNSIHVQKPGGVKFNIKETLEATRNFSLSFEIGQGGFGKVFKGRLKDGTLVAVKRSKKSVYDKYLEVEFQSEIQTLAKVEHLNLVKFYGYLEQEDENIVVLEYVPNGTLREHLDCIRGNILSLAARLDIGIDVAHAITYLHMYTDHPIIHRDIKSSNILLRENFRAKIADFGFATLAADNDSGVKGTTGYLDPEYPRTSQFTEKSDVFSFGVLLVELVTGRRSIKTKQELKERITAKWYDSVKTFLLVASNFEI